MRKLLLLCCLLYAGIGIAYGQSRSLTGTVSDQTGHPLEAVTVTVLETQKSVSTDAKGRFTIQAQNGQNLRFTYVGAQPGNLLVTSDTRTVTITLDMGTNNLNEVVVTGYQQERKKDLTGAVSVVNVKDIQDIPAGNAIKALQGRVPGVTVTTDGSPAGNVRVQIRGIGTLNNT
ncbi:MAG: carboxypeptidase-like regulatory domain-containing protein, partial [Mucilaginibacter sp.]